MATHQVIKRFYFLIEDSTETLECHLPSGWDAILVSPGALWYNGKRHIGVWAKRLTETTPK